MRRLISCTMVRVLLLASLHIIKEGCLDLDMKISDPYPVAAEQFLSFHIYNSLEAIIWVKLDIKSEGIGIC